MEAPLVGAASRGVDATASVEVTPGTMPPLMVRGQAGVTPVSPIPMGDELSAESG